MLNCTLPLISTYVFVIQTFFNMYGAAGHKNSMISHNTVNCSSYHSIKTLLSYRTIPKHDTFIPSSTKKSKKVRRPGNLFPAVTKIQEQTLLPPRYCGISDVSNAVSPDQTNQLLHTAPNLKRYSDAKQHI
jgi:hypothetical protein